MTRSVYLARPIDQAGQDAQRVWNLTGNIRKEAGQRGWAVYDPAQAWYVGPRAEPGAVIRNVNNMALGRTDALIALVLRRVPSVGVPMEIQKAAQSGHPVAVFTDLQPQQLWSLAVMGGVALFTLDEIGVALDWLEQELAVQQERGGRQEPLPVRQTGVMPGMNPGAAKLPSRTHPNDAGLDLYVSRDTKVEPGAFVDIPCSIAVELPDWTWGLIIGRSSTLRRRGLLVHPGVIDSGFRGELFTGVLNPSDSETVVVRQGERLGQLIIFTNQTMYLQPAWVDRLSDSSRGSDGFGSSGQ